MDEITASEEHRVKETVSTVRRVYPETHDTVTIELDVENRADYVAGQFISIDPHQFAALAPLIQDLEARKGRKEPRRSYSLTSAPHEPGLIITVKAERFDPSWMAYPPLLSPFLNDELRPGMEVRYTGPSGLYVIPPGTPSDTPILHVAAGSGVVPNFSVIKHDLLYGDHHHTLVLVNKTADDIYFRQAWAELQARWPTRMRVIHCLTRQKSADIQGELRLGRPSADLIRSLTPEPSKALFFVCGPAILPRERREAKAKGIELAPRFMESIQAILTELAVPREHVKKESW